MIIGQKIIVGSALQGTFAHRLKIGLTPAKEWGPQKVEDRLEWEAMLKNQKSKSDDNVDNVEVKSI